MGAGRSKQVPISYEEACHRIDPDVLNRIEETFRRSSVATGYLPQNTFIRDILGDGVPHKLAEEIYRSCGGTHKGLSLKDLVCCLALLAHGTVDEKAKFLSLMLSEDGTYIVKESVEKLVSACDPGDYTPVNLNVIFSDDQICTVKEFKEWLKLHPNISSFTKWLLVPGESGFSLVGDPDPPTFYQRLGDLHGLKEKEVMDLERMYWSLKSGITTGAGSTRFDIETFSFYASPPVPQSLCRGLFEEFDVNTDGQLDLEEMVRAVGRVCRGSFRQKHELCFRVFDEDGDGLLSREELTVALALLQTILRENSIESVSSSAEDTTDDVESMVNSAIENFSQSQSGCLNKEEYFKWAESTTPTSLALLCVMYQVCHVRFGLRPRTMTDETVVIGGYLLRFQKAGLKPGDTVYVIDGEWFKLWKSITGYEGAQSLTSSGKKKKKKKDKHRHKKRRTPSPQPPPEDGKAHVSTQTMPALGEGLAERGVDVVELLTVAEGVGGGGGGGGGRGGRGGSPNSSLTGGGEILSQASSWSWGNGQREGGAAEGNRIPLIDNSSLLVQETTNKKVTSLTNEGGFLQKKVLVENEHFVFLPHVVWKVFTSWYGTAGLQGGPSLPRLVKPDGKVDYYPVQFKVYRHTTQPPTGKPSSLPWPIASVFGTLGIISSSSSRPSAPQGISSAGLGLTGSEDGPVQPPIPRRVLYYYAVFTGSTTIAEMSEYVEKVLHVKSEDLRLYDMTDEENPVHLDDETETVDDLNFTDGQKLLIETRNRDNSWPEEIIAVMKEVKAKEKDVKEKQDHDNDVQVAQGATGLSNLGNTCFMNSALQCVSNVQPLTQYFREKDYLLEINKDNPLGMGGVMAKRYGELVQDLWNGHSKSITPLKFRFTVGRCAPRFNGFQQQDAQELLAFVLDGLHEDLNRVKQKPYMELKDSDGRPDAEVSREAWDYHLSRNRSVIVDLFQGQLKSVVRCKVCDYKSVRFDPFTFLSLPLPMDSTVNIEAIVVRLDGSQPMRCGLKLEVDNKYKALSEALSRLTGIRRSNLLLAEVFGATIKNFPPETTKIRAQLGGWLYAFEVPDPLAPLPHDLLRPATTMVPSPSVTSSPCTPSTPAPLTTVTTTLADPSSSTALTTGEEREGGEEAVVWVDEGKESDAAEESNSFRDVKNSESVNGGDGGGGGGAGGGGGGEDGRRGGEGEGKVDGGGGQGGVLGGGGGRQISGDRREGITQEDRSPEEEEEGEEQEEEEEGGGGGEEEEEEEEGGGEEEEEEGGGEGGGGGEEKTGGGGMETRRELLFPRNCSIDGSDIVDVSIGDLRPPLDRPLGSRDLTPPIILAPEDDDRLTGGAPGLTSTDQEAGPGSHDLRVVSHDTGRGVRSATASPLHGVGGGSGHRGYIFAMHRKKFQVDQYFVASQKDRPVLFGTPVVVSCTPTTLNREIYERVWLCVQRLIIPDKPSSESKERRGYPFKLSLVGKDALSCAVCPWHMFCKGCPLECDESPLGERSSYIAIDWDINTLHLKYQSAQERPVEHESMESLKSMDLDPIDLYECFKAFVREDDLGDEECWYCKQCKTHQEAVKSLEIWRLPPILIIHLKRFQFFNGRWVKSQRKVRFVTSNLEPLRYTVQNGNQPRPEENGIETEENGMETVENGMETEENGIETGKNGMQEREESQSEPAEVEQQERNHSPPDTRPDQTMAGKTTPTTPLANGEGVHPAIITTSSCDEERHGEEASSEPMGPRSTLDELDQSLHRRERTLYDLMAITCHSGVMGGGHYTSFCKNPNGLWYYYNDSSCKETTEERIHEESPYMLFYEMKDLDHYYPLFRALKGGKRQDISSTEDDQAYEETLKNLSKKCCIQ